MIVKTGAVFLAVFALAWCPGCESAKNNVVDRPKNLPANGTTVGEEVREIEATDLAGVPFKLSEFRGKIVLLSFWAAW